MTAATHDGATALRYRTLDGTAEYRFSFERFGSVWRAVIVDQPAYGSRPPGSHESHRMTMSDRRHYVCWTPEPTSLDVCKEVAATWADCTQEYLRSGTFGSPAELPEAVPRCSGSDVEVYESADRTGIYVFRLVPDGRSGWIVRIERQPPYAGRADELGATRRRMADGHLAIAGGWGSRSEAVTAAGRWAEHTQEYVRSGRPMSLAPLGQPMP